MDFEKQIQTPTPACWRDDEFLQQFDSRYDNISLYGCGIHDTVSMDDDEHEDHFIQCKENRALYAADKEIALKNLRALDLADRSSVRRNGTKKPKAQNYIETDLHSGELKDSYAPLLKDTTMTPLIRRQKSKRHLLQRMWYCNDKDCICLAKHRFASMEEHDEWVEQNRYICEDDGCICQDKFYTIDEENHGLMVMIAKSYYCPNPDCICDPDDIYESKADHDGFVQRKKYFCSDEDCECENEMLFQTREEHDDKIAFMREQPRPENAEKPPMPTVYGFGETEWCPCGGNLYSTMEEHNMVVDERRYSCGDANCRCNPNDVYLDETDHEHYLKWLHDRSTVSTPSPTTDVSDTSLGSDSGNDGEDTDDEETETAAESPKENLLEEDEDSAVLERVSELVSADPTNFVFAVVDGTVSNSTETRHTTTTAPKLPLLLFFLLMLLGAFPSPEFVQWTAVAIAMVRRLAEEQVEGLGTCWESRQGNKREEDEGDIHL